MTDIETLVRTRLDLRYPRPTSEPDWDDVLQRLGRVLPARRRRRRMGVALIAAVLAVGAASLAIVAPWRSSPGFVEQALAAIGSGRYVHVELQRLGVVRQLDLASGEERTLPAVRSEQVYDSKTGLTYGRRGVARSSDPAIRYFVTGYRTALQNGTAHVVGSAIVDGQKARILRFPSGNIFEDVAVSVATHKPLRIAQGNFSQNPRLPRTANAFSYRVLAIDSSMTRPTLPKPKPHARVASRNGIIVIEELGPLRVRAARTALGRPAVWAGPVVAGAELRAIHLQRLVSSTSTSRGLELDYRAPGGVITLQESVKPEAAYGFFGIPNAVVGLDVFTIPAPGQALVSCEGCRSPGATPPEWRAQLRSHGLYVTIRSRVRSLVVAAARALEPMP
jgi:hypothetical protein